MQKENGKFQQNMLLLQKTKQNISSLYSLRETRVRTFLRSLKVDNTCEKEWWTATTTSHLLIKYNRSAISIFQFYKVWEGRPTVGIKHETRTSIVFSITRDQGDWWSIEYTGHRQLNSQ